MQRRGQEADNKGDDMKEGGREDGKRREVGGRER